jgi:hypothetical protein
MKRGMRIPFAEAEGLGTLIGRRPDATELFRSAGSIFAHNAYESLPVTTRKMIRHMPRFISRPMAMKRLAFIADKYFDGSLTNNGSHLSLKVPESVTVNGSNESGGCVYYEQAFNDLITVLMGTPGYIDHVQCIQRGEPACEWRADISNTQGK